MKSLILAAAVLSTTAHAQYDKPLRWNGESPASASIQSQPPHFAIRVTQGGQVVVALKLDGTVEFGPGVTPNEAALAFWRQVVHLVRERTCK